MDDVLSRSADAVGKKLAAGVRMKRKYRFMAGGAVIVAVVGLLLLTSMRSSTVYYLTVDELTSQVPPIYGERVRVAGQVDRDSVDWVIGGSSLEFDMVEGEQALPVTYEGIVPDAFAQSDAVVVEGEYSPDGVFRADTLVVQCPSKYEARVTQ
jgi:cytochrome c-type biogenesis protein CcmE